MVHSHRSIRFCWNLRTSPGDYVNLLHIDLYHAVQGMIWSTIYIWHCNLFSWKAEHGIIFYVFLAFMFSTFFYFEKLHFALVVDKLNYALLCCFLILFFCLQQYEGNCPWLLKKRLKKLKQKTSNIAQTSSRGQKCLEVLVLIVLWTKIYTVKKKFHQFTLAC